MAAAMERQIALAKSLDPRLLRLFKRFPPPQISPTSTSSPLQPRTETETIETASTTSPSDPNASTAETEPTITTEALTTSSPYPTRNEKTKSNPFLPFRNPSTGNWHSPHYSLRRQAELFKLATHHNVLPLMPISPKHPEVKELKLLDKGLQVQGTGEGKKVKGKKWERTLRGRLEERRKAMEGMPEMVRLWKERGHGRGWRKWPK